MMFHLAPPDVNGFGSITSTSGFVRSAQVLIPFGLPLRTTRTTTDLVTKPSYWFWLQVLSTRPAPTSRAMSGASENPTTSAGSPACLLYTSDAADDLLCVDLGGRRIIKK